MKAQVILYIALISMIAQTVAAVQNGINGPVNFVAFSFDTSEIIGNFWSSGSALAALGKARLRALTNALTTSESTAAQSILRVGGTDADNVFWNVSAPNKPNPVYTGDKYTLNSTRLEVLCEFVRSTNLSLVLGLNGGIHHRHQANKSWNPAPARSLLEYLTNPVSACNKRLYAVELTNEPNLFLESQKFYLSGKQLAQDYLTLHNLLVELNLRQNIKIAGVDVAYQFPVGLGPLVPTTKYFLEHGGGKHLDILTWHWYALESKRCPFKGKFSPASQESALSLHTFNKADEWEVDLHKIKAKYAPNAALWLGEMALVSCGGAKNITNTFCGSFWYLDELCRRALRGNQVVVRQTITGSNYGMVDTSTLKPLPDYWTSLMFTRFVGTEVFNVTSITVAGNDDTANLRAYAFSNRNNPGTYRYTLVLLNIDHGVDFRISNLSIDGVDVSATMAGRMEYHVTTSSQFQASKLDADEIGINNMTLLVGADNRIPPFVDWGVLKKSKLNEEPLLIPSLSFAFVNIF